MWLFRKQSQYLEYLFSGEGIYPLLNILRGIQILPVPKMPKEVRQMLGLTGYYQEFIQAYSDLVQPWHNWLEKGYQLFELKTQKSLEMLDASFVQQHKLNLHHV